MKKSFLILALSLVSASFSFANTNTETPAVITKNAEAKISVQGFSNLRLKVVFANVEKNTASIEIYNSNGDVFYQDLAETDKPLVLNVSHLEDGAYTLAVSSGEDKVFHEFKIESQVTRVAVLKSK